MINKKSLLLLLLLVLVLFLADFFVLKRIIYPVVFSCVPSGGSGNYFKKDKCCPRSKVHMYTMDEGPVAMRGGTFTCE